MGGLGCALAALLLAGSGAGTKHLETTLQDDAVLLHRPAAQVRQAARQIADLGVDRIRVTAGWSVIAPAARSKHKPPAPFDASDPRTYPDGAWKPLETAVAAARDAGLDVQIDLAFWAPRWAVPQRSANAARHRYMPDPGEFAAFSKAVVRRFGTVRTFTTWNEPNHPSFLSPQWLRTKGGGWRPASPHVYRQMHNAAYDAIKSARPDAKVLVGGTASTGSDVPGKGGVPPLRFLRELACVDEQLRPLAVPECANYEPLRADGYAHHPYSRYTPPGTPGLRPDDAPIASTGRLGDLLRALHAAGRLAQPLRIHHVEYGYEASEDDPFQPYSRADQARFLSQAAYLAWRDPDTQTFGHFLLRDVDPRESGRAHGTRGFYRDWQSGLFTHDGVPKPAARAFRLPFWAETHRRGDGLVVLFWGEVRPGAGRRTVRVEQRGADGGWRPVTVVGQACDEEERAFLTDPAGVLVAAAPATGVAEYRFAWQRGDGSWDASEPVTALPASETPVS